MKHFLILLFCSVLFSTNAFAQTVSNVITEQQGNDLLIFYTLEAKESCEISLYVSTDGGRTWQGPLLKVTGDVGKKIAAGKKHLRWTVLEERESLVGNQIQFKVVATGGFSKSHEPEMVFVQGGTFTMGCTEEQVSECYDNEKPIHRVTLDDFYIGKYEVTQAQWKAVMGGNPSYFLGCDNCPVENVSWDDVQKFIRKLNSLTGKKYDLPTEAQWEYAARGGSKSQGYMYSGSNDFEAAAWHGRNSGRRTHPVGTRSANEIGLHDMSGNVMEWCRDTYGSYYSTAVVNPHGPSTGSDRVLRGGSWKANSSYCRVTFRYNYAPSNGGRNIGFRLFLR